MATQWKDKRPMAPHLQIWRWHPAMLSSILHRACSIASYVALILAGIGMLSLALTGTLPLKGLVFSPLGALGLFVVVFALTFMALAQARHLVWDQGKYFDPETNNRMSWIMIVAALIVALVLTMMAVANGGA